MVITETEEVAAPSPEAAARECHILPLDGSMIALCGFDCHGRTVHSTERCVLEHHARCFECARLDGGGIDRWLRDVLDDRPF